MLLSNAVNTRKNIFTGKPRCMGVKYKPHSLRIFKKEPIILALLQNNHSIKHAALNMISMQYG